jgi:hypothetical protein
MLFFSRQRCIHLTAMLGLTPNSFAADRREAPPSTYRTSRMRKSSEYARDIAASESLQTRRIAHPASAGNPSAIHFIPKLL